MSYTSITHQFFNINTPAEVPLPTIMLTIFYIVLSIAGFIAAAYACIAHIAVELPEAQDDEFGYECGTWPIE